MWKAAHLFRRTLWRIPRSSRGSPISVGLHLAPGAVGAAAWLMAPQRQAPQSSCATVQPAASNDCPFEIGPSDGPSDAEWEAMIAEAKRIESVQQTPLRKAAGTGDVALVAQLLKDGAIKDIETADGEGLSPLLAACRGGHAQIATTLLRKGASAEAVDKENWNCIFWACEKGHKQVIEELRKVLPKQTFSDLLNAEDVRGLTPLHVCAWQGRTDLLSYLIPHARSTVVAKTKFGETPLHHAVWHGHASAAAVLLKAGGDLDTKCEQGRSPRMVARARHLNGDPAVAQALGVTVEQHEKL